MIFIFNIAITFLLDFLKNLFNPNSIKTYFFNNARFIFFSLFGAYSIGVLNSCTEFLLILASQKLIFLLFIQIKQLFQKWSNFRENFISENLKNNNFLGKISHIFVFFYSNLERLIKYIDDKVPNIFQCLLPIIYVSILFICPFEYYPYVLGSMLGSTISFNLSIIRYIDLRDKILKSPIMHSHYNNNVYKALNFISKRNISTWARAINNFPTYIERLGPATIVSCGTAVGVALYTGYQNNKMIEKTNAQQERNNAQQERNNQANIKIAELQKEAAEHQKEAAKRQKEASIANYKEQKYRLRILKLTLKVIL